MSSSDPVVAFYAGGRDAAGRTLEEIWRWPDDRLERLHDYIQWMFPTTQRSAVNPEAPLVTAATVRAFAEQPALGERLGQSLERMLSFYGLRRAADGGKRIELDPERFEARAATWLHPGNHNHLRLTRIMDSLASLGRREDARALQRCLVEDVANGPGRQRITPSTIAFWRRAT